MSIIKACHLSASDIARLGNNLGEPLPSRHQRRRRRVVAAVNRSLVNFGERVEVLHRFSAIQPQRVGVSA